MTQAACRLAADDNGDYGARPPLVLLHGLIFDRSLWRPSLAELPRIDPGRRVDDLRAARRRRASVGSREYPALYVLVCLQGWLPR